MNAEFFAEYELKKSFAFITRLTNFIFLALFVDRVERIDDKSGLGRCLLLFFPETELAAIAGRQAPDNGGPDNDDHDAEQQQAKGDVQRADGLYF